MAHLHRNKRSALSTLLFGLAAALVGIGAATAAVREIQLPSETALLKVSSLPGYKVATQKCGICHSADYINLQPPQMSLTQWTAEMVKMQHSYGAPIDDAEIKVLGVYLAAVYGDASTIPAADLLQDASASAAGGGLPPSSSASSTSSVAADKIDVQSVLNRNACLGCHALTQKVVGPAYHDVAVKYANDPRAHATVEANIRAGGSGKWGAVPMPAFRDLSSTELAALADFILKQ